MFRECICNLQFYVQYVLQKWLIQWIERSQKIPINDFLQKLKTIGGFVRKEGVSDWGQKVIEIYKFL